MTQTKQKGEHVTLYFAGGLKDLAQSCADAAETSLSRYVADAVTDRIKRDAIKAEIRGKRKLAKQVTAGEALEAHKAGKAAR